MITIEDIRARMLAADLVKYTERLVKLVKPAIRFETEIAPDQDHAIGATKIGGFPDLPSEVAWPKHGSSRLGFIAQFNLYDLRTFDSAKCLPKQGLLQFFYDCENLPWGYPEDKGSWRVLYQPTVEGLLRIESETSFPACILRFREALTLPVINDSDFNSLNLTIEEFRRYQHHVDGVTDPDYGDGLGHQLLGHPAPIQGGMEDECQFNSNGVNYLNSDYHARQSKKLRQSSHEWRLLLQVDSDEPKGMMWADSGRLYFWIRQDDLTSFRFDKVWFARQCS